MGRVCSNEQLSRRVARGMERVNRANRAFTKFIEKMKNVNNHTELKEQGCNAIGPARAEKAPCSLFLRRSYTLQDCCKK